VNGTKDPRHLELENERLRTENLELKSRLNKSQPVNTNDLASDEIRRLERLVHELREQLKSKRPVSSGNKGGDWEREKMELELELQRAELRV